MRKAPTVVRIFIAFFLLISAVFALSNTTFSKDELEKVQDKINDTKKEYNDVSGDLSNINSKISEITRKITGYSSQIGVTQNQINELLEQINSLSQDIVKLQDTLEKFNGVLLQKESERNEAVKSLYKNSRNSVLEIFFASSGILDLTKKSAYFKSYFNQATSFVKDVNLQISNYKQKKEETEKAKGALEVQKGKLDALKANLARQVKTAQSEVSGLQSQANALEDQLKDLSDSLDELTSKQEKLLREKFGASSERLTVGESESGKQSLPNPGFSPAYAFFTRGYPHRVGMNQYGAKGRADDGQDYEDILEAYYPNTTITGDCDKDQEISVVGYGDLKLEEYLYGLGEMPSSWNIEA